MNPGRELDALVAERVMGWRAGIVDPNSFEQTYPAWRDDSGKFITHDLPKFSADIASAFEVLEKFRICGDYKLVLQAYPEGAWEIKAYHKEGPAKSCSTSAATLPLTICLAALKAVGIITLSIDDCGDPSSRIKGEMFELPNLKKRD